MTLKMKKILFPAMLLILLSTLCVQAQQPDFHGGFGNMKPPVDPDFKDVDYAGDDLEAHRLDIYLPKTGKAPYKAVIAIYGSAWFSNNMKAITYFSFGKPLLDAGFAVVAINHRSSGDEKFPAQIHDVKGAIRFIKAHAEDYKIDESFIGITGFSSGGHLASMAGVSGTMKTKTAKKSVATNILDANKNIVGTKTETTEIKLDLEGNIGGNTEYSSAVDAVVDWFGPVDMRCMSANCEGVNDEKSPEAALIGGAPAENPELIELISPAAYLKNGSQPLPRFLVIHGDADNVVPYCQSKRFAEELDKRGVLEEFITVPNGQHGPITFNDETFKKMTDFFVKEASKK